MKRVLAIAAALMCSSASSAQQQQVLPLTEWRAQLDHELGKILMTREAHGQVIGIMQAAERQAQAEKMAKAKETPKQPPEPPKEGQ